LYVRAGRVEVAEVAARVATHAPAGRLHVEGTGGVVLTEGTDVQGLHSDVDVDLLELLLDHFGDLRVVRWLRDRLHREGEAVLEPAAFISDLALSRSNFS